MIKLLGIRQAVILAAGVSSRFEPFTSRTAHKSTFQLGNATILEHTLHALGRIGMESILVVYDPQDTRIRKIAAPQNSHIQFISQAKPLGQANALEQCLDNLDDRFLMLNSEYFFIEQLLAPAQTTINQLLTDDPEGIILTGGETDRPQDFGIITRDGNRVLSVVEKPQNPPSNFKSMAVHVLTKAYVSALKELSHDPYPNFAGFNVWAQQKHAYVVETPNILTLKYSFHLLGLAHHWLDSLTPYQEESLDVHPTAIIDPTVTLEKGVKIGAYTKIYGPSYVGRDVIVGDACVIRPYSVLHDRVTIGAHSEISASILDTDTHIHRAYLGNSILGESCRIGAGFISANRRLDRGDIAITIKGKRVSTHSTRCGVMMGDHCRAGIQSGTNPGTLVPSDSVLKPGMVYGPKL